jgi:hypothetical protein
VPANPKNKTVQVVCCLWMIVLGAVLIARADRVQESPEAAADNHGASDTPVRSSAVDGD